MKIHQRVRFGARSQVNLYFLSSQIYRPYEGAKQLRQSRGMTSVSDPFVGLHLISPTYITPLMFSFWVLILQVQWPLITMQGRHQAYVQFHVDSKVIELT